MYQTIRQFHRQFLQAYQTAKRCTLSMPPVQTNARIYLAGMGGSSLPADMVNDYLGFPHPLHLIRHYHLPSCISREDYVFCSSYSGNTEETLSVFEESVKAGTHNIVLSHGGQLARRAEEQAVPVVSIPDCIQPRCATGYFFGALLALLEKLGLIASQEKTLQNLEVFLGDAQDECESIGKELAHFFSDRVPLIYGPSELAGICRIWKIKINENAKVQSFYNVFPELNHNEMVGFTKLLIKPAILCLQSQFMDASLKRRMQVMGEVLGEPMPYKQIVLKGDSLLQEMFYAYLLADYSSYYLAHYYKMDPAPVAMVEDFKKRLG